MNRITLILLGICVLIGLISAVWFIFGRKTSGGSGSVCTRDTDCDDQAMRCDNGECICIDNSCSTNCPCSIDHICSDHVCIPAPECSASADCKDPALKCQQGKCVCIGGSSCSINCPCPPDLAVSCQDNQCVCQQNLCSQLCPCPNGYICSNISKQCEVVPPQCTPAGCHDKDPAMTCKENQCVCIGDGICSPNCLCVNDPLVSCINGKCVCKTGSCSVNCPCPGDQICCEGTCCPGSDACSSTGGCIAPGSLCVCNSDCELPLVCSVGKCTKGNPPPGYCSCDSDCSNGYVCDSKTCTTPQPYALNPSWLKYQSNYLTPQTYPSTWIIPTNGTSPPILTNLPGPYLWVRGRKGYMLKNTAESQQGPYDGPTYLSATNALDPNNCPYLPVKDGQPVLRDLFINTINDSTYAFEFKLVSQPSGDNDYAIQLLGYWCPSGFISITGLWLGLDATVTLVWSSNMVTWTLEYTK